MFFKEYSHMENDYKILKLNKIQEILSDKSVEFVALEKIHGTNFSFITDGNNVSCCRRSNIINPDENFYCWEIILEKYKPNIIELFNLVKQNLNLNICQIQLYGELYGGSYPGIENKKKAKRVQKGVYYSNSNEFACFDLKYWGLNLTPGSNLNPNSDENIKYLDWENLEKIAGLAKIPIVPIIQKGSWEQISKLNPKFESEVYKRHQLEKIDSNWAEGYVIKPLKEIYLDDKKQERLIWKFKNPSFLEVIKTKCTDQVGSKLDPKLDPSLNLLIKLQEYVNSNRYDNVVSKVIDGTSVSTIVELFYNDVWVDFIGDLESEQIILDDEDKKACGSKLRGLANKFVRSRYNK